MIDKAHQGKDSGSLTEPLDDDPDIKNIISQEAEDGISQSDDSCTKIIVQCNVNDVELPSNKSENAMKVCSHVI